MIIPLKKIIRYLKYIALVLLWAAWLLSFSNAASFTDQFNLNQETQVNNSNYTFTLKWWTNFSSNNWWKVFWYQWSSINYYMFRNNDKLYTAKRSRSSSKISRQWYIPYFCYFDHQINKNDNIVPVMQWNNCNSWTQIPWYSFYWFDQWSAQYLLVSEFQSVQLDFCFVYSNKSYCSFITNAPSNWTWELDLPKPNTSDLADLWTAWDNLKSYYQSSPFSNVVNIQVPVGSWVDWYNYNSTTTWDLIDYFEWSDFYKFTPDICYIWTRDLVSVYEDRIPYYQWTWYTIFDFYWKLFNVNSFDITQVWSFINTRYINYSTWFLWLNRTANGDPLYNAYYTYWSWFWLDQWSWLTSPFTNNLAAFYFLWSTTYDLLPWLTTTPWEEIATYCYKKLQTTKWTPSNDWSSYNINDNHNPAYDSNAWAYTERYKRYNINRSWADSIQSQSRDWTPLDYFEGDWSFDFNWFFSNAFNKFKNTFWNMSPSDFWVWALPWYIILFLIAIIFFRFLSH